jgi:hypothetical protein
LLARSEGWGVFGGLGGCDWSLDMMAES